MIKPKKYIYTIFSVIFIIGVIGYLLQPKRDLPQIKRQGILKVVVPTDSFYGFEYDLLQSYLRTIDVEAHFEVEKGISSSIEKLKTGECDLLLRLIPTTQTLKDEVLFTQPIAKTRLLLLQNQHNNTRNYNDLENDTIVIEKKSPYLTRLYNLQEEIGLENLNIMEVDATPEEITNLLTNNNINFTIYDEFSFHLLPPNKLINAQTVISTHHFLAWAVAPICTLLKNDIDTWLTQYTNSLSYRDLIRKYYH